MTERNEQFQVGDHPRLEVSSTSGDIAVVAGAPNVIDVTIDGSADKFTIEKIGDTISVHPERGFVKRMFSSDIRVEVPSGTEVEAKSVSGDVVIDAEAASLAVSIASGDVRARNVAGHARVKAASGEVAVDHVHGTLVVVAASGDVRVAQVDGDLSVKTASGDVNVGRVGGSASLNTASGDLRIARIDGGDVEVRTLSGDVAIGIPPRRRVELDMQSMSGDLRNRLPQGDGSPPEATVRIRATSVSGDVVIKGASS